MTQQNFTFANGYGASVISDGYGGDRGLYELAVMADGRITYSTPVADDVIGFLDKGEVLDLLAEIAALPRRLGFGYVRRPRHQVTVTW